MCALPPFFILIRSLCPALSLVAVAGVVQPIKEIGRMCRAAGAFLHTDAAQAVGKIPMSVNDMNIDLMSISGHKIYGPKGIGAIYIRRFVDR